MYLMEIYVNDSNLIRSRVYPIDTSYIVNIEKTDLRHITIFMYIMGGP